MLKHIRILLVIAFLLAAGGAGFLFYYKYTHEDIQAPVFRSNVGQLEVSVNASKQDLCRGLYAFDNVDGDITSRIMIRSISQFTDRDSGTFRVSYIVFDSASNYATYERTVRYTDYTSPHFRMSKPMIFNVGDTISFLDRISATDCIDGNITGRMILSESTVSNSIPGTYRAVISVTNRLGDTATLPLTVMVVNHSASAPKITLSKYLIYYKEEENVKFRDYVLSVTDPLSETGANPRLIRVNTAEVDASTPGVYPVYYYYTGTSGEIATTILNVVIE